jgi:hypothetical protein
MILLIGLPKSGTTSFQYLFKSLGYKSYHWKKDNKFIGMMIRANMVNKKPLLCDFSNHDAITQMDVCVSKENSYWPQIENYKQLYEENPDSIFILNKRDPKNLLSSFKRWNNYDKRLFEFSPHIVECKTDEGFINFVNDFYTEIEAYFSSIPNCKFLTFDIENDKIEKLNRYIDIKGFKQFPKKNVNKKNN